jgi:hypothetical protein
MMSLFCRLIETRHATQILEDYKAAAKNETARRQIENIAPSSQVYGWGSDPKISAKKCEDMHFFLCIY